MQAVIGGSPMLTFAMRGALRVTVALVIVIASHLTATGNDDTVAAWADGRAAMHRIVAHAVAPDSQWFAYVEGPLLQEMPGKASLFIKNLSNSSERVVAAGDIGGYGEAARLNLSINAGSRWVAFHEIADGHSDVRVMALSSDKETRFENADVYAFNKAGSDTGSWIAVGMHPSSNDSKVSHPFRLILEQLDGCQTSAKQPTQIENVSEFAFNVEGRQLATIIRYQNVSRLRIYDLRCNSTSSIIAEVLLDGEATNLTWSPRGDAIAVTVAGPARAPGIAIFEESQPNALKQYYAKDIPGLGWGDEISVDAVDASPLGYEPRPALMWRADGGGLFFGVRKSAKPIAKPVQAKVVIWNSMAPGLPLSEQTVGAKYLTAPTFSYLAYLNLRSGRAILLADEEVPEVRPSPTGKVLFGYNQRRYFKLYDTRFHRSGDYFIVDLETGRHDLIIKNLTTPVESGHVGFLPQLSPDGRSVVYIGKTGDVFSIDLASHAVRNITKGKDRKIFDPTYFTSDANRDVDGYPSIGAVTPVWTTDGRHLFLAGRQAIWLLSLDSSSPQEVTRGIASTWSFALVPPLGKSFTEAGPFQIPDFQVSLSDSVYLSFLDPSTKETGLISLDPGSKRSRILWRDRAAGEFWPLPGKTKVLMARQRASEYPDYYILDINDAGARSERLTILGSECARVSRCSSPRLLRYRARDGQLLQAILYPPTDFAEGRRYPTIVCVYERQDQYFNAFATATAKSSGECDIFRATHRGYAVLLPSYYRQKGGTGASSLYAIVAAVRTAIRTGVVDRNRLGLWGHSYGAYTINYLVTQTNLFKAAISLSGPSSLKNMFLDTYGPWPDSAPRITSQPYIGVPPWDDPKKYYVNSPINFVQNVRTPILLVHGSKDPYVDPAESVRFFNALRFLGKAPAVLLEYADGGHTPAYTEADSSDLQRRSDQFFDHFLKGAPAPYWWSDPHSYGLGQAPEIGDTGGLLQ